MAKRTQPTIYSEVDAFFRLNDKNELILSKNGDAVADSIRNIVKTTPGERVMNPDFGCNLMHALFEPQDEETAHLIGEYIWRAIVDEEPRVIVDSIIVTPDSDNQAYDIGIDFRIRNVPTNSMRLTMTLSGLI